jgi:dTDP-4-amino-4,6-dideoxygalactose transaminase
VNIPFIDYYRSHNPYRGFVMEQVARAASSGEFILKQMVHELEFAISQFTGAAYSVATANATGALLLALHAMGIKQGKEVILPAFGFPSPVNSALNLGARPVFVDVDPQSGMLNPDLLAGKITENTRVIIPMHLGRSLAEMEAISRFASDHGLLILEDSAVAFGAYVDGRSAGRWGHAGVFSFFPTKPLSGIGDGGMLITDDESLAGHCRRLRNHGQNDGKRFIYEEVGWNSRMDEIPAAYLLKRLQGFAASLQRRREIAGFYDRSFAHLRAFLSPVVSGQPSQGHHVYVIQMDEPARLRAYLSANGIQTQLFHPVPLPFHPGFANLGYKHGDFPAAERLASRTLALPSFPELEDAEIEYIAGKVIEFYER